MERVGVDLIKLCGVLVYTANPSCCPLRPHTTQGHRIASCCPLRPHTTALPDKTYIGVIYGVLLWADMNAATPSGAWGRSVHCTLLGAGQDHRWVGPDGQDQGPAGWQRRNISQRLHPLPHLRRLALRAAERAVPPTPSLCF